MVGDGLAGCDGEAPPAFAFGRLEALEEVEEGEGGCGGGGVLGGWWVGCVGGGGDCGEGCVGGFVSGGTEVR